MFKRILIANRGEIAMRILRCCHEMGIETVLACSKEDLDSLPAQFCTKCICIGPAPAAQSYLNENAILSAAKACRCDAIHPGYGFLSENAHFARMCEENNIVFIGPDSQTIRRMGDKQSARALMQKSGVPVVPGSGGILADWHEAARIARKVGYPVLLKATAGGGGRGLRAAHNPSELRRAYEDAQAEAQSAFGSGALYLEKLIEHPRHIEVQILGDTRGNIIQLGERDCSMQRRNQKLMEEAPASLLSNFQRTAIRRAALKAARAAHYISAGTVEFVLDQKGKFYFIEMNTRIQVEHPVTEMVTGVDLVREQIRIAAGLPLSLKQSEVRICGHAIECRINAEDPARNFMPAPGEISFVHFPGGNGVRVESAIYPGAQISPYYDSMIAKIIVHAPGRLEAVRKMRAALGELTIEGVKTNISFLYLLMHNGDYLSGRFDTGFLGRQAKAIVRWGEESLKHRQKS